MKTRILETIKTDYPFVETLSDSDLNIISENALAIIKEEVGEEVDPSEDQITRALQLSMTDFFNLNNNKEEIEDENELNQDLIKAGDLMSKEEKDDVTEYLLAVKAERFKKELIAGEFKSHDLIERIQLIKNKYLNK